MSTRDLLALWFYNRIILSYEDYVARRDAPEAGAEDHLRAAIATTIALYHFRENLPNNLKPSVDQVVSECGAFKLIGDVTNAVKHGVRTDLRTNPLVIAESDIRESVVITEYTDEEGSYSDAQTIVTVHCVDGINRSLDEAITTVLNYWGAKLRQWGEMDFSPRKAWIAPGSIHRSRDKARPLGLKVARGLDFVQLFEFRKFDSLKYRAVYRAPQPGQKACLEVKQERSGDTAIVELPFSNDEHARLAELSGDKAEKTYLQQLMSEHETAIEMVLKNAFNKSK